MDYDFNTATAALPLITNDFEDVPRTAAVAPDASRRSTRYLIFAGDVLPSKFKRDFPQMAMGGESLGTDYHTLTTTKGILRRCQITPMVTGKDYLNYITPDELNDGRTDYLTDTVNNPLNPLHSITRRYKECLPGDEIGGILDSGADMGIREVEILRGEDLQRRGDAPPLAGELQREIFPEWDDYLRGYKVDAFGSRVRAEMFPTLAGLENYLFERRSQVGETARDIITTILDSAAQFRRWGTSYLDAMGRLVKAAPTAGGSVYSWSELALQLFDYLELNRDEFLMKRVSQPEANNAATGAEMQELRRYMAIIAKREAERGAADSVIACAEADEIKIGETTDYSARSCADPNAQGNPCKGKVIKEIDGRYFCASHPKSD